VLHPASQITLTLLIFFVAIFTLGFVGDFIINLYLDPVDLIASATGVYDDYDEYYTREDDASWTEHFIKGFASLGLLGFVKAFLANPYNWFHLRIGGGRRGGNTGRDRVSGQTWLFILAGAGMVLYVSRHLRIRSIYIVFRANAASTGCLEEHSSILPSHA